MLTLSGAASLKVKELIQAEGDEALALRVAVLRSARNTAPAPNR